MSESVGTFAGDFETEKAVELPAKGVFKFIVILNKGYKGTVYLKILQDHMESRSGSVKSLERLKAIDLFEDLVLRNGKKGLIASMSCKVD